MLNLVRLEETRRGGNGGNRIFGKLGEIRSRQGAWHAILVDCKIGLLILVDIDIEGLLEA